MNRYNKWVTTFGALTVVGVLAGCGSARNVVSPTRNTTNMGTTSNNTGGSNPIKNTTTAINTSSTDAANTTPFTNTTGTANNLTAANQSNPVDNSANGNNSTSATVALHPNAFVFYVKCQPNQTYTLFGGGPGGASAPLGKIKTGAAGWVETPLTPSFASQVQSGWIYQFGPVGFAYLTQAPQLAITPNTPYIVKGHPTSSNQNEFTLVSGETTQNGYIAIPEKPGWNITIQYTIQDATHSVQIRIPVTTPHA